ncbi:MAG: hypothetical protein A3E88_00910 [Legionellales bacterium RIFCSPHIGHO2_12_FULL_35_11]|nr:MAG: hypothetical protein A3E88_00910 [Legionellales bacterium RIFCSPHIGHO2_12_FULL_35_11]
MAAETSEVYQSQAKTGKIRENSLFYFIKDNQKSPILDGCSLQFKASEQRTVCYIYKPNDVDLPIFRENIGENAHFTVDKFFSLETSQNGKYFGPIHFTVSYDIFILHIYFNKFSIPTDYIIKNIENNSYLSLSQEELDEFILLANDLKEFVQSLYKKKNESYIELYQAYTAQITQLRECKDASQYLQIAKHALSTLEKFNSYDDKEKTKGSNYLKERINYYSNFSTLKAESSSSLVSNFHESQNENECQLEASCTKIKPKMKNDISILKENLDKLKHYDKDKEMASYLDLVVEINDLSLVVLLQNIDKQTKKYIMRQKKAMPINLDMIKEEFSAKLQSGDVQYMENYYEQITTHINAFPILMSFLKTISDTSVKLPMQLPLIKYLCENFELCKSVFYLYMHTLIVLDKKSAFSYISPLLLCVKYENYAFFAMLLELGALPNTVHLLYNSLPLNALQAVLLFAAEDAPQYVSLLLNYKASFSLPDRLANKKQVAIEFTPHGVNMLAPNQILTENNTEIDRVIQDNNAFISAVRRYATSYPLVIEEFTPYADVNSLLASLGRLCIHDMFFFTILNLNNEGYRFIISQKENKLNKWQGEIINMVHNVMRRGCLLFLKLNVEGQKKIINDLATLAARGAKQNDFISAFTLYLSCMIACTFMTEQTKDVVQGLGQYIRLGELVLRKHGIKYQAFADQLLVLYKALMDDTDFKIKIMYSKSNNIQDVNIIYKNMCLDTKEYLSFYVTTNQPEYKCELNQLMSLLNEQNIFARRGHSNQGRAEDISDELIVRVPLNI